MTDGYSVVQFFEDNATYEYIRRDVTAKEAVLTARDYCYSLGARLGTTQRVIITDDEDFTVFEWRFGEGVVFPTADQCRACEPDQGVQDGH